MTPPDDNPTKIKKTEANTSTEIDSLESNETLRPLKKNSAFISCLPPNRPTSENNDRINAATTDSDHEIDNSYVKQLKLVYTLTECNTSPFNPLQFHIPRIQHPLKAITRATKIITQTPSEFVPSTGESSFTCKLCKELFCTGQALGGHMSRKHPGLSIDYMHKKEIRDKRDIERKKLLLAKIKFFKELGFEYLQLRESPDGKKTIHTYLNRSKLKKLKQNITNEELEANEEVIKHTIDAE